MNIKNNIISGLLFITLIFFISNINLFCQTDADVIIAKIGNKTITKMEFMNRAEFTPRPDYCRLDNYIHKKIVLNTLIAEKLMAAEAGENNELTNTPEYAAYINGRKEQAMRQIHYYKKAFINSKPDSADVANVFSIAGRTYNISYFRIKDSSQAHNVFKDLLNSKKSFDSISFAASSSDKILTKQISYLNQELPVIHNALFSNELIKGEILVPVYVDDSYLFIRIDSWTDRLAISEKDIDHRWSSVYNKLTEDNAVSLYEKYISEIMRGKNVSFNYSTFKKLVEITAPYFLQSSTYKKGLLNSILWTPSSEGEVIIDNLYNVDDIKDWNLLTIDGEIWTVEKLMNELKKHPLVFRKKELIKKNFAEQMKLSIIDLIRDKYITQDAYKYGFDNHPLVLRNVSLWQDNLLAIFQKFTILESVGDSSLNRMEVIDKVMNPYIRELQKKYSNVIKINIKEFEKIQLTSLDMITLQPDQAFPFIVPLFPELTTINKLDYGEVIN